MENVSLSLMALVSAIQLSIIESIAVLQITKYIHFAVKALKAAAAERKEVGYKDWIEQAVAKSDDPDATRERIENFTRTNNIKGTAIMAIGGAALLAYSATNPYTPPGL